MMTAVAVHVSMGYVLLHFIYNGSTCVHLYFSVHKRTFKKNCNVYHWECLLDKKKTNGYPLVSTEMPKFVCETRR